MSDLVERLRERGFGFRPTQRELDAADEIERLRVELAEAHQVLQTIFDEEHNEGHTCLETLNRISDFLASQERKP